MQRSRIKISGDRGKKNHALSCWKYALHQTQPYTHLIVLTNAKLNKNEFVDATMLFDLPTENAVNLCEKEKKASELASLPLVLIYFGNCSDFVLIGTYFASR